MGDFGAVSGTLRGFGLFWGRREGGEGTMEVLGVPKTTPIKARGAFPGSILVFPTEVALPGPPCTSLGCAAFIGIRQKKIRGFFACYSRKRGRENPS